MELAVLSIVNLNVKMIDGRKDRRKEEEKKEAKEEEEEEEGGGGIKRRTEEKKTVCFLKAPLRAASRARCCM